MSDAVPLSVPPTVPEILALVMEPPVMVGLVTVVLVSWLMALEAEKPLEPPAATCWEMKAAAGCVLGGIRAAILALILFSNCARRVARVAGEMLATHLERGVA